MHVKLLDETASTSALGPWHGKLEQFLGIVGYSPTGTLFLCCGEQRQFGAFYPAKPGTNLKSYGEFAGVADFEAKILNSPGFELYSLFPINPFDLPKLEELLGPLGPDEIYIPVPYGFAGGSLDLETFEKGNVFVSAAVVGSLLGI